jgi:hypothetical protein
MQNETTQSDFLCVCVSGVGWGAMWQRGKCGDCENHVSEQ